MSSEFFTPTRTVQNRQLTLTSLLKDNKLVLPGTASFQMSEIAGSFLEQSPAHPFKLLTYEASLARKGSDLLSDCSFLDDSFDTFKDPSRQISPMPTQKQCENTDFSCVEATPRRMYCACCQRPVGTLVKFHIEDLPFWRRLCCSKYSSDAPEWVTHSCRFCNRLLATFPHL